MITSCKGDHKMFKISALFYFCCLEVFEIQQELEHLRFESLACDWHLLTFYNFLWSLYSYMCYMQYRLCHAV